MTLADDVADRHDLVRWLGRTGEPLDHELRARYERRLGVDLSHVRVYAGELATALTRERGADALTIGATGMILLGDASARAGGAARDALLAHELVHVAQAARRGADMPFAEEHEREAEEVERDAIVEAREPAASPPPTGDRRAELVAAVRARVLELAGEAAYVATLRGS